MLPYPDQISQRYRWLAQRLLSAKLRRSAACYLQELAQRKAIFTSQYRASHKRLAALHNQYLGATCVIIGNGPSLRQVDSRLIAQVPSFGLNRGYLWWRKHGFEPTFYVAVNELVLSQFGAEIAQQRSLKFIPWRHRDLLVDDGSLLYFRELWTPGFRGNALAGLWAGGTVTYVALQLAFHMGFSKVVLVGVDHRFAAPARPNAVHVSEGEDRNHFSPDYFGAGIAWNLPDLETSEYAYSLARAAFEAAGRSVVDATVGGALTVFPHMELAEALQGAAPIPPLAGA